MSQNPAIILISEILFEVLYGGPCRIRVKSYHKASEQDHQYRSEPSWVSTSALMKPLRILAILEAS